MAIALITNYLVPYRTALFAGLAERHELEVLCFGAGGRYVPEWFADLDAQLARAPFPARRLDGPRETLTLGRRYELLIAPFAGGAILPAAYASARMHRRPFVLWASVWAPPRSLTHALTLPLTRRIYRDADAVITYGEHVRRFVAHERRTAEGVFIAPQSVEPELFGRTVTNSEIAAFRARHDLGEGPVVLFVGRLVPEKGIGVLLEAWQRRQPRPPRDPHRASDPPPPSDPPATLVVAGDGPLAAEVAATPGTRLLGPVPRTELPVAYALAALTVVPSIPAPRWREPWGLVCNEAMHQACPVVATTAVGAVAGGLVRENQTGLVVPPGDPEALAAAIERLLADAPERRRLGRAGRDAVGAYSYEAMLAAFDRALAAARARPR